MPVVIDANAANSLAAANCESSVAILSWVRRGGQVASGGALQQELSKTNLRPLLAQWSAAGRLRLLKKEDVDALTGTMEGQCTSNDSHVLAVLVLSDSNIVITGDVDLHKDVENVSIVNYRRKIINCTQGTFSSLRVVRNLLQRFG